MSKADDEEIAKALASDLLGPTPTGGIRKLCTDAKRCGMGPICEHAQTRDQSCDLISAWTTHKYGECGNYLPRTELGSTGDVPRSAPGRGSRHNRHAPDRATERARILGADGKPIKLPDPPDLMVKRHIRNGQNIKGDDE